MLPPSATCLDPYEEILVKVWPELAAYVRRCLRSAERDDFDDFMADAALDLHKAYQRKGPLTRSQAAAVVKEAFNKDLLNHRAKLGRRNTYPCAVQDELLVAHADPDAENGILAMLGRVDCQRLGLMELLPRLLTERQRKAIAAVDIERLEPGEAAAQLGIGVPALRKLRNSALQRLRQHLAPERASSPISTDRPADTTSTPSTDTTQGMSREDPS
jgi:DNA-directed RNA polymerase specialized sigma24 family protein